MAIFYDPNFTRHTPSRLLLSTGIRALDHAVETIYHPNSSEVPWKTMASTSIKTLFEYLPALSKSSLPANQGETEVKSPLSTTCDDILVRLHLAAWAAAGLRGSNFGGGMGLSHSLGHALGSPYGIARKLPRSCPGFSSKNMQTDPRIDGDTSCLTLAPVVRLMARHKPDAAAQISRLCLPSVSRDQSEDEIRDSMQFASCIEGLVAELDLVPKTLSDWGVKESDISVIVQRAMKGPADEKFKGEVESIVKGLF